MDEEFKNNPITIQDIGEDVFLKVPFYKRKKQGDILYINKELYEKIFKKKYNFFEAREDILKKFNVSLEENGEMLGYGYVDFQSDPTDIALNGNKGSGRAFYLYKHCNIKGDKTPLATSMRNDYNNGKYSMDCAIQEALISNILANSLEFDTFETLAVIDTNEEYKFPYTDCKLPCAMIVRYYKEKELYRFSHRFVNNKPFTREEIINIARKIGKMEGKKFTSRFLHGAWSIGNLSIDSNMIDLDTSFFTQGRGPQWSFTDKYITNYFGFEEQGQIKVMETIINSHLNIDNVMIDEVMMIINEEKRKMIQENMALLLGYDYKIYRKYENEFNELANLFYNLAQLIFDNYDSLNCLDRYCNKSYLFNFSKLFRYYEIAKQNNIWSISYGLDLLVNKDALSIVYDYDNYEYHEKIRGFFEKIIIKNEEEYLEAMKKAICFIKHMDELTAKIDKKDNIQKDRKLVYSYIQNEDRKYLMARKWMRAELIDLYKNKGSIVVNEVMNMIIQSYTDIDKDKYISDLYIANIGIIYREVNTNGYFRYVLKLYDKIDNQKISVKIDDIELEFKSNDREYYYSEYEDNITLEDFRQVSLRIDNKYLKMLEIGKDKDFNDYIIEIDSEDDIKKILKDNYNIVVLGMERVQGGTTEAYIINTSSGKYFLKIFEDNKDINEFILEIQILDILKNNDIPVADTIKTYNKKMGLLWNGRVMMLQEFIEGKTYHDSKLPTNLLLSSAALLGKIHQVLKGEYGIVNKLWLDIDIDSKKKEIAYLLSEVEKIKDDDNYELLKKIIQYRMNKVDEVYEYSKKFNNLTFGMSHNDYSKRQLICNDNKIEGVVDFSSCDIVPLSWEVVRSYFLSTLSCKDDEEFDYELFSNYIYTYLTNFKLSEDDLKMMPYLMIYQIIMSNYGYMEYISGYDKQEIDFIKWKYKICLFLENNKKISNYVKIRHR